ncbi:unnamed protein product [Paramecium sonneborni]|uniref:Uncharacterized protein n=1 Tax=Paramecium sonneborni TaxID=65129 RepID=A0A8S1M4S1_9CILI|nr:unnamed protein product [Paramecium sonneborni]
MRIVFVNLLMQDVWNKFKEYLLIRELNLNISQKVPPISQVFDTQAQRDQMKTSLLTNKTIKSSQYLNHPFIFILSPSCWNQIFIQRIIDIRHNMIYSQSWRYAKSQKFKYLLVMMKGQELVIKNHLYLNIDIYQFLRFINHNVSFLIFQFSEKLMAMFLFNSRISQSKIGFSVSGILILNKFSFNFSNMQYKSRSFLATRFKNLSFFAQRTLWNFFRPSKS